MAPQANAQQQAILDQLQGLANELGHIPSRAEFDASDLAKALPIWRINGLLHSFDKATARLADPAIAALTDKTATQIVLDWAASSKELPTPTAWTRSIRNGADLPAWADLLAASGLSVNQLQDMAHQVLAGQGLVPTGKSKTRYEKPSVSAEITKAKQSAPKPGRQARKITAEDRKIAAMLREERTARAAAGVRQGRLQGADDRAGSELWIGQAS